MGKANCNGTQYCEYKFAIIALFYSSEVVRLQLHFVLNIFGFFLGDWLSQSHGFLANNKENVT